MKDKDQKEQFIKYEGQMTLSYPTFFDQSISSLLNLSFWASYKFGANTTSYPVRSVVAYFVPLLHNTLGKSVTLKETCPKGTKENSRVHWNRSKEFCEKKRRTVKTIINFRIKDSHLKIEEDHLQEVL